MENYTQWSDLETAMHPIWRSLGSSPVRNPQILYLLSLSQTLIHLTVNACKIITVKIYLFIYM
jgi:hypothetical protein